METSMRMIATAVGVAGLCGWSGMTCAGEPPLGTNFPHVQVQRVPNSGIQPQTAADAKGVVHLIYFTGDPRAGVLFYVHSEDGEKFSEPIRINSEPGSAIAVGNIRGAQVALGKNGRIHVAWMGSEKAKPRGPSEAAPMLYTRLNDAGAAFAPQRNVIQSAIGLDGGGTVAADNDGNVYVVWHAPTPGMRGEENRCVWMARSKDEGKTFAPEIRINPDATGACGCCGMRAHADPEGNLFVLYRSATSLTHRDMYLLTSKDHGATFRSKKMEPWNVRVCPMSSMGFASGSNGTLATWETESQVSFARIDSTLTDPIKIIGAPGQNRGRKHSVLAVNAAGETLMAWTEGIGWNKGGSLAWQVFDANGEPTKDKGQAPGVPVWSTVSAFSRPDGQFVILY
jgi:hypothetical protein